MVITVTATPLPGQAVVLAQVQRRERDQLVAVDDGAVAVDREHAVAVAVEGEAGVVAPLAHRVGEALDVGGAAAVVDVAAVRVGREQVDLGAEAAEDLRARRGGSRRWRSRAGGGGR